MLVLLKVVLEEAVELRHAASRPEKNAAPQVVGKRRFKQTVARQSAAARVQVAARALRNSAKFLERLSSMNFLEKF